MTNSVDLDQTAPIGAVCSGSTLFASIPNSSAILGIFLQQTTSADNIFRCGFLGALLELKFVFIASCSFYGKYFMEICFFNSLLATTCVVWC